MNSSNNYELLLAPNKLNHSTLFVLFLRAGRAGALGWGLAAAWGCGLRAILPALVFEHLKKIGCSQKFRKNLNEGIEKW